MSNSYDKSSSPLAYILEPQIHEIFGIISIKYPDATQLAAVEKFCSNLVEYFEPQLQRYEQFPQSITDSELQRLRNDFQIAKRNQKLLSRAISMCESRAIYHYIDRLLSYALDVIEQRIDQLTLRHAQIVGLS